MLSAQLLREVRNTNYLVCDAPRLMGVNYCKGHQTTTYFCVLIGDQKGYMTIVNGVWTVNRGMKYSKGNGSVIGGCIDPTSFLRPVRWSVENMLGRKPHNAWDTVSSSLRETKAYTPGSAMHYLNQRFI